MVDCLARLVVSAAALLLLSCAGHTVVGQNVASPHDDLKLAIVVRGEPGKAYVAKSDKTVYVSVAVRDTDPPKYLMRKKYDFVAEDLDWKIEWLSADRVRLELIDRPDEIDARHSSSNRAQARHFATYEFARISPTTFEEVKAATR